VWCKTVPPGRAVGKADALAAWIAEGHSADPARPTARLRAWSRDDEWRVRKCYPAAANFLTKPKYQEEAAAGRGALAKPQRQLPALAALPEDLRDQAVEEAEALIRGSGHIDMDLLSAVRGLGRRWARVDTLPRVVEVLARTEVVAAWLRSARRR